MNFKIKAVKPKKRKGFRNIVVNFPPAIEFQYTVSLRTGQLICYNVNTGQKYAFDLIPEGESLSWRGKHDAGGWGKREVAILIKRNFNGR